MPSTTQRSTTRRWGTVISFLHHRGGCWDRWRRRTERSCSVFRPRWFLQLYNGWFWPGLRISGTEQLSTRSPIAPRHGNGRWKLPGPSTAATSALKPAVPAASPNQGQTGTQRADLSINVCCGQRDIILRKMCYPSQSPVQDDFPGVIERTVENSNWQSRSRT